MAERRFALKSGGFAAGLSLAAILAGVIAGFAPVATIGLSEGWTQFDPYLLRVVRFTLLQATLSTGLSLLIGIPVARALARQSFRGRALILRLFLLPLALPAIVAILGIVTVYGAGGWLGSAFDLYGLTGILIAHVFFNAPLAARLILARIEAIPAESFRLGAALGFQGHQVFRLIEWPQIRPALAGLATLIFLLCTASFAVVLTLGGGPRATTLEVAIYQALRFDFDPARATALSLVQIVICCVLAFYAARFAGFGIVSPPLRRYRARYDGGGRVARIGDFAVIALSLAIVAPPVAAVVAAGVAGLAAGVELGRAVMTSLAIATATAIIAAFAVWPLAALAARAPRFSLMANLATLGAYVIPPAVLATGWFILFSRYSQSQALAPVLVVALNSLMALPFAYGALAPAVADGAARHDRLCAGLGLAGLNRFRLIDFPLLRRPLALTLMVAGIVSLGDLTAIMMFGSHDLVTLPALIYRQMGSYRMAQAAGTALILAAFAFVLIMMIEKLGRQHDPA